MELTYIHPLVLAETGRFCELTVVIGAYIREDCE